MEKLTLEELAPYLPYKLLITREDWDFYFKMVIEDSLYNTATQYNIGIDEVLRLHAKPILRPLSDLNKTICHKEETFIPSEKLQEMFGDITRLTDTMQVGSFVPYGIVKKLFEWHFDVNNLISRKLALDINTQPNN